MSEVDLMHVLHRPDLPRLVSASVAAFILAIVISLVLASSLSNISQPGNGTSMPADHSAGAPASALRTTAPRWASNPFASLLSWPVPQLWLTVRP
jgi:hypothetical protein